MSHWKPYLENTVVAEAIRSPIVCAKRWMNEGWNIIVMTHKKSSCPFNSFIRSLITLVRSFHNITVIRYRKMERILRLVLFVFHTQNYKDTHNVTWLAKICIKNIIKQSTYIQKCAKVRACYESSIISSACFVLQL